MAQRMDSSVLQVDLRPSYNKAARALIYMYIFGNDYTVMTKFRKSISIVPFRKAFSCQNNTLSRRTSINIRKYTESIYSYS